MMMAWNSSFNNRRSSSRVIVSEIEEEESSSDLFEISRLDHGTPNTKRGGQGVVGYDHEEGSLFSLDFKEGGDDVRTIYVPVFGGKSSSSSSSNDQDSSSSNLYSPSMDALVWTLKQPEVADDPSSAFVYLIHVFPELRYIPSPLGKLPLSQVNPEQKESYMVQERSKRREFLQKFLHKCSSFNVKVETILIESDMEAKAILDLIPILNIGKLVLGTTKSDLRKMKSRRGSGVADQIIQNAPEFCKVKVICQGKEISEQQIMSHTINSDDKSASDEHSPPPRRSITENQSPKPKPQPKDSDGEKEELKDHQFNDSFACICFSRPKVVA